MKYSLLLIAVLLLAGCAEDSKEGIGGQWNYQAFNDQAALVVTGQLNLTQVQQGRFSGTWHLQAVGSPHNIGPQVGDGNLTGQVLPDGIHSMNLNPDNSDNNVTLSGTLDNGAIRGEWDYIGIAGILSKGRFLATRPPL